MMKNLISEGEVHVFVLRDVEEVWDVLSGEVEYYLVLDSICSVGDGFLYRYCGV